MILIALILGLDALVAAVTAKIGFNRFLTIPEIPPVDSKGLRMEMVYFALGGGVGVHPGRFI